MLLYRNAMVALFPVLFVAVPEVQVADPNRREEETNRGWVFLVPGMGFSLPSTLFFLDLVFQFPPWVFSVPFGFFGSRHGCFRFPSMRGVSGSRLWVFSVAAVVCRRSWNSVCFSWVCQLPSRCFASQWHQQNLKGGVLVVVLCCCCGCCGGGSPKKRSWRGVGGEALRRCCCCSRYFCRGCCCSLLLWILWMLPGAPRNRFLSVLCSCILWIEVVLMGALFVIGGALQVRVWPWRTEQANRHETKRNAQGILKKSIQAYIEQNLTGPVCCVWIRLEREREQHWSDLLATDTASTSCPKMPWLFVFLFG